MIALKGERMLAVVVSRQQGKTAKVQRHTDSIASQVRPRERAWVRENAQQLD